MFLSEITITYKTQYMPEDFILDKKILLHRKHLAEEVNQIEWNTELEKAIFT